MNDLNFKDIINKEYAQLSSELNTLINFKKEYALNPYKNQSEELCIVKDPGENGNVTDVAFPTSSLISY